METKSYKNTITGCYVGLGVQAIVINFVPLLFLTFKNEFGLPIEQITLLSTLNFLTQLIADASTMWFVERIGYRASVIIAHSCCALGLGGLAFLPDIMPPLAGLICAVIPYSAGAGILQVVLNPIVESCPESKNEAALSLLHSFYCWGLVITVGVSMLLFAVFGIENWRIFGVFWALVPALNAVLFALSPMPPLPEKQERVSLVSLLKKEALPVFLIMMFCAGATEHSICQWASAFTESALGVSKTTGDLLGPCMFAIMCGTARLLGSKLSDKIKLSDLIVISLAIAVTGYVLSAWSPLPIFGFIGCAFAGFGVGILWPGTFSLGSSTIKNGGTTMFAVLSIGGSAGCTIGPSAVGLITGAFGGDVKKGLAFAAIFPAVMLITLIIGKRTGKVK